MPNFGKCAGEEFAAFSGIGVLTSYLVLFISFYIATYNKSAKGDTNTRQGLRRMSQAPLPDPHHLINGEAKANGKANGKTSGHTANGNGNVRSRKA